ncbi:MAG TPA: hypothetical protein VL749_00475 [Patescibacteria group bacterium]|nr:hypothetical protein [Patescibacteria group bacterium]
MTTDATATRSSTTRSRGASGNDRGSAQAVQAAVHEVRSALQGVGRSMPEVVRVSRGAVDDLMRAMETGSDQQVTAGVSLSLGLAIGMLLGGAPRLLIALALAPVAIMGIALAERRTGRTRTATTSS